jgi:hypothetical protein
MDVNGEAIIDRKAPRARRFVAVEKSTTPFKGNQNREICVL